MTIATSIREEFFKECEELLEALSEGLDQMHDGTHDGETLSAVFRAVHSIKGGAGAFALSDLVAFAHRFETMLDHLRSGLIQLGPDSLHLLLRLADHLSDLVAAARVGADIPTEATGAILSSLESFLTDNDINPHAEEIDFTFSAIPMSLDMFADEAEAALAPGHYTINFRPTAVLYANGHDPSLLIGQLAALGTLEATLDLSQLPDWRDIDPKVPNIAWVLHLTTVETEAAVTAVFEFVLGLCALEILPSHQQTLTVEQTLPEISVEIAMAASQAIPCEASSIPAPASAPFWPQTVAVRAKLGTDAAQHPEIAPPNPTLRVALDRVDRLMNAVGELITNQAMIARRVDEMSLAGDAAINIHVENYHLLARDLQEAVMAIRAQPAKPLFQRMSRILREAADATGKLVRFQTEGENIEVDKTVIERLADPLTHMIRNAVDHGLESSDVRLAAGKPACGTIRLSAAHRSGRVIITISDDGAGLNRQKILETARRKGLIALDQSPSAAEIDELLFLPGFSTASEVSNLSGRGVGLDVVRTAVATLGGRVSITSTPGQGTEFTISLPLTLAVMDGMIVSVAGQTLVVPIASILETIRPEAADLHQIGIDCHLLSVRGRFIPLIDVGHSLGFASARDFNTLPLVLLIEAENRDLCAFMIDEIHDQLQVVIKGLDNNYCAVPGVSAATVLDNGQIALILDTDAIAARADMSTAKPQPTISNLCKELPMTATDAPLDLEFVTFCASGQKFGIDIAQVKEIRRWGPVTPLPHAPHGMLGVMNLRGSVIPVFDLAARLGLSVTVENPRNVIVVAMHDAQTIGLLVESVAEILSVARDDIQTTPDLRSDSARQSITGLITAEDGITRVIDLAALVQHQVVSAP